MCTHTDSPTSHPLSLSLTHTHDLSFLSHFSFSLTLSQVRRWRDFAPFVTKLTLRYDPGSQGTSAVQELRRQARVGAVRREFPKYVVEAVEETTGSGSAGATVTVVWTNGKTQTIQAQHAVLLDIFDAMAPTAEELQWAEEDKEMQ